MDESTFEFSAATWSRIVYDLLSWERYSRPYERLPVELQRKIGEKAKKLFLEAQNDDFR
jgi:hypothetical protein